MKEIVNENFGLEANRVAEGGQIISHSFKEVNNHHQP